MVYTKHFPSSHVYFKGDVSCQFFIYIFGGVETSRSGCESKVIDNTNNKKNVNRLKKINLLFFVFFVFFLFFFWTKLHKALL